MKYIENSSLDPYFNLALEEYFLRQKIKEDIVCLWQNDKTVVIGRHQNIASEVNQEIAAREDIKIARRITGGGAVYHDLGNLNYTFITNFETATQEKMNFKDFAQPILKTLAAYGIEAEISGRNDILFDGKKISGTAQACIGSRILFHGTLLYDLNSDIAEKVLLISKDKVESKGVKSVKSRIGNIRHYLPDNIGFRELKLKIAENFSNCDEFEKYELTKGDINAIKKLSEEKYATKKWIYGESPKAEIHNKRRYDGGEIECWININNGCIDEIKFCGDFLGIYGTDEISNALKGVVYDVREVKHVLEGRCLKLFFGDIAVENIVECMFMTTESF